MFRRQRVNQLSTKKACKIIHCDLANAQRLADEKAINPISNWFEDMQPFNEQTPKESLVSFSTGFISRKGDGVNPEETIDVGNTIQKRLDGRVRSTTVQRKSKAKSLANFRKLVSGSDGTAPINALKYFNRLVLFAQRENNLESSLGFYELTLIPMSLFSEKDQLMHEGDKATSAKSCLKDKIDLTDNNQDIDIDTVVIDGGWLLRQCTWVKGDKWRDIIDKYCKRVKYLGRSAYNTVVVFDGYENSTKDHTHQRRRKQFCHDIKIREDMIPYTIKEKFLLNSLNKSALVSMMMQDDADITSPDEKLWILFCHSFGGCDTFSLIFGVNKEKFYQKAYSGQLRQIIDKFYCDATFTEDIGNAGILNIYILNIYNMPATSLSKQRLWRYNKQAKRGVIRPASLPPTNGSAIQHSLRAYLQIQDWILLKSMSRDPRLYGWYVTSTGQFEPIMTLDDIAPANLLRFVSCNCSGDCTTKRCFGKKGNVKCISACGGCHGILFKNNEIEVPLPESD